MSVEAETCGGEERDRGDVARACDGEGRRDAEPRRQGMQAVLAIVLEVEERIEHVEARDPDGDGSAE